MAAKITDVARRAGVSIATVSNVINDTRPVRPETRQRVLEAIRQLQYVPDSAARHFKTGKQRTVGFVIPDISNTFFACLVNAVEEVLDANGYDLILANTHEDPEKETKRIHSLCSGKADALILASALEDYRDLAACIPEEIPHVLVDRVPLGCRADAIQADGDEAIARSVQRLAEKGHTRVGLLGWKKSVSTTQARADAFLRAAQRCALEARVEYSDFEKPAFDAAQALLSQGCTALLAGNSKLCLDLLSRAQRLPRRPEILTFCDSDGFERLFGGIPLIVQPTRSMGRLAARRILSRLQDPALPAETLVLPCTYRDAALG